MAEKCQLCKGKGFLIIKIRNVRRIPCGRCGGSPAQVPTQAEERKK